MFNTTLTRTTSHGYTTTITLADAMVIRERNRRDEMCRNVGEAFHRVGYWLLIEQRGRELAAAKRGSRRS